MNDQIEPAEAARALSEIGLRREQVIRRAVIPGWHWWATAVLTIALAASIEYRRETVIWVGITVFVVGSLVINRPLRRALRSAPPRRDLAAPSSVPRLLAGLAAFAAVLMGVGLATGLSLKAAGVPYPGTIATTVTMVMFVLGGQLLTRYHTASLVRRAESQP